MTPLRAGLTLLALLLAACGGGGAGTGDLTGKVSVPEGYVRYAGAGVSFVHPRGWKVSERPTPDGGTAVDVSPPSTGGGFTGGIGFSVIKGGGERFESLLEQRRTVIRTVGGAKIESDEPVDLVGAERVQRVVSRKDGSGPTGTKSTSESLDVLREDGDVVLLIAEARDAEDQPLDPEAVVSSLRLEGG